MVQALKSVKIIAGRGFGELRDQLKFDAKYRRMDTRRIVLFCKSCSVQGLGRASDWRDFADAG
jgi:hypothetical protein